MANPNYVELKAGYSWSASASEPGDRHHGLLVAGLLRRDRLGLDDRNDGRLDAPQFHVFTPVINGVLGWQKGDSNDGYFVNVNGTDDEYYYWNAGLNLAVENISFDFRYWDTNIGGDAANICAARFALRRALRVLRQGRGSVITLVASSDLQKAMRAARRLFDSCSRQRLRLNGCHLSDTGVSHASAIRTRAFEAFGRRPVCWLTSRGLGSQNAGHARALKMACSARPEASFAASAGYPLPAVARAGLVSSRSVRLAAPCPLFPKRACAASCSAPPIGTINARTTAGAP